MTASHVCAGAHVCACDPYPPVPPVVPVSMMILRRACVLLLDGLDAAEKFSAAFGGIA
jgi:hypothetical protein